MTVAAKTPLALYDGDGVTTAFAAPWRYLDSASLKVELLDSAGAVTPRTLGVHFTATAGSTDAGGTVTMVTAPAVGQRLRIKRMTPRAQPTQYPTSGAFPASSHELALDRTMMAVQEQAVEVSDVQARALQAPEGETIAKLPAASARSGKLFAFDGSGKSLFDIDADKVRDIIGAVFNPIFTQLASLVMFTQAGVGALVRSVQTRGRETIHVTDYGSLAEAVAAAPAGGCIYIPKGYTETLTASIPITKSLTIYADNWWAATITGPANAPIFDGTGGAVNNFVLRGITWIGGAGASKLLYVPDFPAANWFEAKIKIEGCRINAFGDFAIDRGNSVYFTEIRGNRFDNCVGCIKEGFASDSVIDDNLFNDLMAGNPVMELMGGSRTVITSNGFVRASGTIATEADIELNPAWDYGLGGRVYIHHNKFGGEGETTDRPKIRVYNATSTNRSTDVVIAFNQLHGAGGSAGFSYAMDIQNPIAGWHVVGNEFDNYDLICKDTARTSAGVLMSNKWEKNRYFWSERSNGKLFENGGRMFTEIDENVCGYQPLTLSYEPREARNRLYNSTSITSWNKSGGVTITGGQADPDGGTNAFLVESDGTVAAQNVLRTIDTTGIGSSVVLRLRLKAQASTKIIVGLRDSTASAWVGMIQSLVIDGQWREYRFRLSGINPANAYQLYVYPGGTSGSRAGGFYIYQPQVSDFESDFLPTSGAAGASDTTIGRRFGRKVSLAGGAKATIPTYADNAAALAGGLLATELYKTATGEVRVVV